MRQLTFHDVPAGPVPLFLGEPREKVVEAAHLLCDHAAGVVYFRPLDPYQSFILPKHSAQRFSVWELDPMMPHRQVVEIYAEARPLIERLHAGTTIRTTDMGWVRSQTPEALTAFEVIDDVLSEEPAAIHVWAPHTPLVPSWVSNDPPIVSLPTGAGKTRTFSIWAHNTLKADAADPFRGLRITDEPANLTHSLRMVREAVGKRTRDPVPLALSKAGSLDRVVRMRLRRETKPGIIVQGVMRTGHILRD